MRGSAWIALMAVTGAACLSSSEGKIRHACRFVSPWIRPNVISSYGSQLSARGAQRNRRHSGIDLGARQGVYVVSDGDGRVWHEYKSRESGYVVTVYHPATRLYTMYAHLEQINVRKGDVVFRGQKIGSVGLFPNSDGVPHLHWEICERPCTGELENSIDPRKFNRCFDPDDSSPSSSATLSLPIRCDRTMPRRVCHAPHRRLLHE